MSRAERASFPMKIFKWPGALVCIGMGALVLRLIYLAELLRAPVFTVVIGDAQQYDAWAQQIASGQWMGSEVFYQTPLYPYLMAVIFKLAGHYLLGVRLVQVMLGALSCVLLGVAGRRFFNQRVGLIAAFLLALYPPAIFFDGLIQKSSLDLFFITLLLAVLAEFHHRPHWKWLLAAGVVIGAFALNRENARVLYPIVMAWLIFYFRDARLKNRMAWAAILTAAIAAALLPVGLRNYHVGGEFLISTSQLGPNFYIGNHAGAQGEYEPLVPGHSNASFERSDATRLAEEASGRKLSPAEVSDFWLSRALDYMRSQPWDWLRLMSRKLLLTFSAREAVDTESIEVYAEYSRLLRVLFWFHFGVILPLGIFGVWQTRADWRRLAILYAMLLGLAFSVVLFYVLARYRYPMVPIVLLFAAATIAALPTIRRDQWRQWLPGVVLALAVVIPSNFLLRTSNDETWVNVGAELIRMRRPAEAIPLLQKAVAISPAEAPPHYNLGLAFSQTGEKELAIEQFEATLQLQPEYFDAHVALAMILEEKGLTTTALKHFREAVRLNPNSAEVHRNLGSALQVEGQREEAIAQYKEALQLEPNDATTHNGLAVALQQDGKVAEAISHYEAALKLRPHDAGTHSNLALALNAMGNQSAAIEHFNEALRLQPSNLGIRVNFGDLLLGLKRTPEATAQYEEAAKLAPDSMEIHCRVAQLYVSAGRLREAISSLEKALAIAQAAGRSNEASAIAETIKGCRVKLAARTP